METSEIVKELLKNDNVKMFKDLTIKNVTVTPKENYVRLGITLNREVPVVVEDPNDPTKTTVSETNIIFVSMYSITSLLKNNDDVAFAVNHFIKHPDSMSVVLSRAKIDIIQEYVNKGDDYKNPFATDPDTVKFDRDIIITNIVNITLSDFAIRRVDKLADVLLGI